MPESYDNGEEYTKLYTKLKDNWYIGPEDWQFPDQLYHLHATRGAGLYLGISPCWRKEPTIGEDEIRLDTRDVPIFVCHECHTIAPDEVACRYVANRRREAVEATRAKYA
jgi:hypothetical protein